MSKKLRVGFDATSLLGNRTGVGRVADGLLRALQARDDLDPVAFAITWRGRGELARVVPEGVTATTKRIPATIARKLWAKRGIPRAERWCGPVDIVHAPNFVAPPARAPVVVTIHDLTFAYHPEMCTPDVLTYPSHLRRALDDGATVHAVSDTVAGEVREHFGLDAGRVVRVYAGVTPSAGGSAARGRALAGGEEYVLALGMVEPRKNLPVLVRAFDALAADRAELRLVIAGPEGPGSKDLETAIAAAHHGSRVTRLGYVGEGERRDLLAGASVLAYPSQYEGFGHPPLEAMLAGVPVVASNMGALPEVLGDAAILVDPRDVEALAGALAQVLGEPSLRDDLVVRGRKRAGHFTWSATGAGLDALYRGIVG